MSSTNSTKIRFRLSAPSVRYAVDISLRGDGDRWLAVADTGGRRDIGLGSTPRAALDAALGALPSTDARALVGDLRLLAPSVELAQAARARRG